jgi:hypothetical protein
MRFHASGSAERNPAHRAGPNVVNYPGPSAPEAERPLVYGGSRRESGMNVLVTVASKDGSTAQIAKEIAS